MLIGPVCFSRIAVFASLMLAQAGQATRVEAAPNVLFIISDDLTAEALGCYGPTQCQTPHIDGLARRGVRFTRAYCQYPVCGPSRAALMSGLYPQAIGVTSNGQSRKFTEHLGQRPSMAEWFKRHRYYTARVSKIYHMRVPGDITAGVDGPDHAASWTERFNCQSPEWKTPGVHQHLTSQKLNPDRSKHYNLGFGTAFYTVQSEGPGTEQADVQAVDKAIELLQAPRTKPFFLAVGLVRPHVPLVAPKAYFEKFPPADMKLAATVDADWSDIPAAGRSLNARRIGLAGQPAKQQAVLAAYYAAVAFMDAQVGRLLTALQKAGKQQNTVVVFTSDHGYHLGEHDFWQKLSLHEESARIPLIIAGPEIKPAVTESLAQQIDLFPTLAELAGLSVPEHCQGKSQLSTLRDPQHRVHDDVYCMKRGGHLLRSEQWAFLLYQDGSAELYDMRNDPRQFTNLVDQPAHAEVVGQMRRRLTSRLDQIRAASGIR